MRLCISSLACKVQHDKISFLTDREIADPVIEIHRFGRAQRRQVKGL